MLDIMKHKKALGIVNLVLIAIALVLVIAKFVRPAGSVIGQIDMLLCMAALLPALIYILSGYGKSAAKCYKAFMYLFAAGCLCSLICAVTENKNDWFLVLLRTLIFFGALLLTFVLNFRKKKSLLTACGLLALELIGAVGTLIRYGGSFDGIVKIVSGVVLACLACMFALCKYADKDARGTT